MRMTKSGWKRRRFSVSSGKEDRSLCGRTFLNCRSFLRQMKTASSGSTRPVQSGQQIQIRRLFAKVAEYVADEGAFVNRCVDFLQKSLNTSLMRVHLSTDVSTWYIALQLESNYCTMLWMEVRREYSTVYR